MNETKYAEQASFQKVSEETWKTKILKLLFFIVATFLAILLLIWIFSDSLFGIPGLNVGKKYMKHMSFEVVLIVCVCSLPLFWVVFRKLKLFINGMIIDFTNLPNVTVDETSKKVKSVFNCDGLDLEIKFGDHILNSHQMEFALMLGEWKTADEIQKVYNNNNRYRKLLKSYAIIVNEQGEEMVQDITIEKINEALLRGDDIGRVFVPEVENDKVDKGEENKSFGSGLYQKVSRLVKR